MTDELKKQIIEDYIEAYNNFDVEKMLANLHEDIMFQNISNGEVTLTLKNISDFRTIAEQSKTVFSQREQKIKEIVFGAVSIHVKINYYGVLAVDFGDELKAGDKIELEGKSIFRFKDGKIIEITDIS